MGGTQGTSPAAVKQAEVDAKAATDAEAARVAAEAAAAKQAEADAKAAADADAARVAAEAAAAKQAEADAKAAADAEAAAVPEVGEYIVAVAIGGTRNGVPWPEIGEPIELEVDEAASYLQFGYIRTAE